MAAHSRVLACLAVTIALAVFPVSSDAAASPEVPFELAASSLVVVSVDINGTGPHRFALDTGATMTMLDVGLAKTLGVPMAGTMLITTPAGEQQAPFGRLGELRIGALRAANLDVGWMPLDAMRRHAPRIVGVLGQDVLARTTMTLDFVGRRLRLSEAACAAGDTSLAITHAEARPMLAAQVVVDGIASQHTLVIDSAANVLVLFGEPEAARPRAGFDTHTATMAGAVIADARVAIGDITLQRDVFMVQSAAERLESGLLPASLFARVCIDGPRARAVLTRF